MQSVNCVREYHSKYDIAYIWNKCEQVKSDWHNEVCAEIETVPNIEVSEMHEFVKDVKG